MMVIGISKRWRMEPLVALDLCHGFTEQENRTKSIVVQQKHLVIPFPIASLRFYI